MSRLGTQAINHELCLGQATYFDQKFHAVFFLAPEEAGLPGAPQEVLSRRVLTPRASNPVAPQTSTMPANTYGNVEAHQAAGRENQASREDGSAEPVSAQPASGIKVRSSAPQRMQRSRLGGLPREGAAAHQDRAEAEPYLHRDVQQRPPAQPQDRQQGSGPPALDPEWEEELMTTIEEQEEAIRSVLALLQTRSVDFYVRFVQQVPLTHFLNSWHLRFTLPLSCREKDDLLDQMQAELRSARLEAAQAQAHAQLPGSPLRGRQAAGFTAEHARLQQLQARNAQLEVSGGPVVFWQLTSKALCQESAVIFLLASQGPSITQYLSGQWSSTSPSSAHAQNTYANAQ